MMFSRYVAVRQETHPPVLPKRRALKATGADMAWVVTKRPAQEKNQNRAATSPKGRRKAIRGLARAK